MVSEHFLIAGGKGRKEEMYHADHTIYYVRGVDVISSLLPE